MYCKFCGSRIDSTYTKCVSCGADIDVNDGGQSFFDDNELDAWQADDIMMGGLQTDVPKTEMREVVQADGVDAERNGEEDISATMVPPTLSYRSRGRKKTKKVSDFLNLSSSNRLIIFCIASALVIVLLVVAIIGVLNSSDETTEETATENATYTQQTGNVGTEQNTNSATAPTTGSGSTGETPIQNVTIKKDGTVVSDKALAYRVDGVVYIAIYDILKHEGYKDKFIPSDGNPVFDYIENDKRKIAVKLNAKDIWFKSENDAKVPAPKYLDYNILEINGVIYVPALSFLKEYGCEEYSFDEQNNILYYK